MASNILAVVSVFIALTAIVLSVWQNVLQSKATQAQVFLNMLERSDDADISDGLDLLASLKTYDNYETYLAEEPQDAQVKIYRLIRFLNSMANLVEDGYLPRQKVWNLYFMDFRVASDKLLPWWLDGLKKHTYTQKFSNFERMCRAVAGISDEDRKRFDDKQSKRSRILR